MLNHLKHFATVIASMAGTVAFMFLVYAQMPAYAPPLAAPDPEEEQLTKQHIAPPPKPREQVTVHTDRSRLEAQGQAFLNSGRSPKELPPLNAYTDNSGEFTDFLTDFTLLVFDPAAKKYLGSIDLRSGRLTPLTAVPSGAARRIFQQEIIGFALASVRKAGYNSGKVEMYWQPSQAFDNYLTGKRLAIIAGLKADSAKVRELRMKYRRQAGRPSATVTSVVFTDGREVMIDDSES